MTSPRLRLAGAAMAGIAAAVILLGQYRPTQQSPLLGLAVAVAAAAAAATASYLGVVRPWWGLVAWLASMPVVNLARAQLWLGWIQVIGPTPIVLSLVLGVVVWRMRQGEDAARIPTLTWILVGAAMVFVVAATLRAPIGSQSLNITLHGVLEPLVVLGCALAMRPNVRQVIGALAAIAASVSTAALVNLGWLFATLSSLSLHDRRVQFARLTYFNVGIFGVMLVIALPLLALVLLVRRRMGWPAWVTPLAWLAIGLDLVALFYTYTKSAWVSVALVLSLIVLLLVRGWLRKAALLVAIYALLAVVVPYPSFVLSGVAPGLDDAYLDFVVALQGQERVESWDPESEPGSGSVAIRWVALGASAQMVVDHPLLGVGPGRYGHEFALLQPDASVPNLASAHNFLANLAAEYGLPLALIVALGLAVAIVSAVPAMRDPDDLRRGAAVTIGAVLVGFVAVATLFGVDLYRPYRTMNADVVTVAVLVGLGLSLRFGNRAAGADPNGP